MCGGRGHTILSVLRGGDMHQKREESEEDATDLQTEQAFPLRNGRGWVERAGPWLERMGPELGLLDMVGGGGTLPERINGGIEWRGPLYTTPG